MTGQKAFYFNARMRGVATGHLLGAILTALVVALVTGFLVWFFKCPCERTPGGYLLGEQYSQPVSDWSMANEVALCQIQVSGGFLPHSINLNCMASQQGELYLSCASCEGKNWSTRVLVNSDARIRIGETVYPVTVTRVTDDEGLREAWTARALKTGARADAPQPSGWWSFNVVSRL